MIRSVGGLSLTGQNGSTEGVRALGLGRANVERQKMHRRFLRITTFCGYFYGNRCFVRDCCGITYI